MTRRGTPDSRLTAAHRRTLVVLYYNITILETATLPRSVGILAAVLCLWPASAAAADAVRIYVSIPPLQFLVEQVGGEYVDAGVVVEAGQRPETYEPSPRQIAALARADAFFGVGLPLEAAWRRQLRETGSSAPEWVDLAEDLPAQSDPHDHDHGEADHSAADAGAHISGADAGAHIHADGIDPHVWLSPVSARRMVSTIAAVLAQLDPGHATLFEDNAARLGARLISLHRELGETLAASHVDAFLVYHPAWGHFARGYGLTQISIERQGGEPGPRGLAEVIDKAKALGIKTVFVDPRHSRRPAATVADAIGARLEVLDPLAYDYFDNLRRAARAIAASRS